jgi:hypothetical protein
LDSLLEDDKRVIVWELKRQNEKNTNIVTFSPTLTACLGSNSAIYPLYSSIQAKAISFYVTDYITKGENPLNVSLAIIKNAHHHINKYPSKADDTGTEERNAMHFLSKLLNDLVSVTETSAPMAVCPLLDFPSFYCRY